MRKFFKAVIGLSAVVISMSISVTAFAGAQESQFNLIFNGSKVEFTEENKPINIDGRTLVQLKTMFELIDANSEGTFEWKENEKEVVMTKDGTTVTLWIDNNEADINGNKVAIDGAAPVIYNGRTYVPLRFVADSFGLYMNWNQYSSTANLSDKARIDEIVNFFMSEASYDYNQSRIALNAGLSADAEMSSEDNSLSFSMEADYIINQCLKDKFSYMKQSVFTETQSTDFWNHTKTKSSSSTESVTETYDDGENSYYGYGDDFMKSPSALSYLDEAAVEQAYSYFDQDRIKELQEYMGFDYSWLAALSLSEDSDGNHVIEGDIFIPDSIFNMALMYTTEYSTSEYSYEEEEEGNEEGEEAITNMPQPIYCKAVFDKNGRITALNIKLESELNLYSYLSGGLAKIKFNLDVPKIDYNPVFESVIPEAIKEKALDWESYYGDYEDYDYGDEEPEVTESIPRNINELKLETFNLENVDLGSIYPTPDDKDEVTNNN